MTWHGPALNLTLPAAAVERARNMLEIEQTLATVSESLFDTIVANEVEPATALAARMLGDYREAAGTVHTAFERARDEFGAYDGTESPRSWVFGYVAAEAVRRSNMGFGRTRQNGPNGCEDASQPDTEAALHCLGAERRLAVILTDVLGMSDEAAAAISGVDLGTVRHRAATARSWIAHHLGRSEHNGQATADGAPG